MPILVGHSKDHFIQFLDNTLVDNLNKVTY